MQIRTALFISFFCAFLPEFLNGQTVSSTLYDDASFNAKQIDQTKPVGAVDGAASVSLAGAATYTIPIKCPPGTNGMEPGIAISYSSQSGMGLFGMGWNLQGLSVITRAQRDCYHDGILAPVAFNNNDILTLDGNRLNLVGGSYGQSGSTYRLEMDNFSTVTMYDNGTNRWFRVITKDGVEMDYGSTNDSRFLIDDNSNVMMWRLNRIKDINGNYVEFVYTSWNDSRQSLISKIKYTGNANTGLLPYNEISFNYTLNPQLNTIYEAGASVKLNALVKTIDISVESNLLKTYILNYGHNNISVFLKEVVEKDAAGNQLNSTVFKYGDAPNSMVVNGVPLNGLPANYKMFSGDFDGDGRQEVVTTEVVNNPGNYSYMKDMNIHELNSSGSYDVVQTIAYGNGSTITYKKKGIP